MKLSIVELGLKRPLQIEKTAVTAPFWDGLTEGEFRVARCSDCNRLSLPPRVICPACHGRTFTWDCLSGKGILYAESKVQQSPPIYGLLSPTRVVIVDLEEGVRVVTRMLPGKHVIKPGARVELVITRHPDGFHFAARMPLFI